MCWEKKKSDFSFLEKERTLGQIKERIRRETGFSPWAVDRYLDILHAWIAEKTGVNPKQVHKILVSYRLSRFRESFVKGF